MKKLARLGTLIAMVGTMFSAQAAVLDFATYNGNTYYLLSQQTWGSAEAEANSLGGHLVTINDAAENAWVTSQWSAGRHLWIGLNDIATEGTYVWSSGEAVTYTNFAPGEPNNLGDEDVVHIWASNTTWNDHQVTLDGVVHGVAEVAGVPAPGTAAILGLGLIGLASRVRARRT